jgi:F0F1-type ATP synthase assembly protein I
MVEAFSMLAAVVVGLFLGVNLDKVLHTMPLFTITFTFLGIGTSIYSVIKKAKK